MAKPIDHTQRFETVGALYYAHSGILRPGKDAPPSANRDPSSPENRAAFDEWMATLCFGAALDRIAALETEVSDLENDLEDAQPRGE